MSKNSQPVSHAPAALGYRMPAEWETHAATWIGWPHNLDDWPGKIAPVQWVYGEIVRKLADSEPVKIIVATPRHQARAERILKRVGANPERIEFQRFATNRGWARDFGPIFLKRARPQRDIAIAQFHFNAWAKYEDWQLDCQIPARAAKRLGCKLLPVSYAGKRVVLEGGAIDVNGCGTVITTEECLLDQQVQVRNPGFSRADMDAVLRDNLGAANVLWLGQGICGDDTHGHVDDLCRFVGPKTVVLCEERNPHDENYKLLAENHERAQDMRLQDGAKLEVVPLPMPAPLYLDGRRLPASYANFYIANSTVLVPTFNDPHDRVALGILAEMFPERTVCGIHAVDLVWGLGTLHCLTQQEPVR